MSKILFVTPPAHGHLNPVLPVMRELIQRGEQVVCCNHEDFRPQIEMTGARFLPYPASILTAAAISDALADGNLSKPHLLMLQAADTLAPFTINLLDQEHFDLVVFDSLAIWGKIAANSQKVKGAATISHFVFDLAAMGLSMAEYLSLMGQFFSQVPRLLNARGRLKQRYGKAYPPKQPLFPMRDRCNLVFTARDLHPKSAIIDDSFHFVGPSINPQIRGGEFPWDELKQKPLVYLSLGTVHTRTAFYQTCFEAFADFPAQFVLSTGRDANLAELGGVPANFLARPTVPQLEILQRAEVFITHGGINSVHEGLYYGVPLVLIPHQFEQLLNARRVVAQNAGLLLDDQAHGRSVTAGRLRQALETVLADPVYAANAKSIQTLLQRTGGYRQAADLLQAYLSGR